MPGVGGDIDVRELICWYTHKFSQWKKCIYNTPVNDLLQAKTSHMMRRLDSTTMVMVSFHGYIIYIHLKNCKSCKKVDFQTINWLKIGRFIEKCALQLCKVCALCNQIAKTCMQQNTLIQLYFFMGCRSQIVIFTLEPDIIQAEGHLGVTITGSINWEIFTVEYTLTYIQLV